MSKEYAEIDAYYIRETDSAICIALDEDTFGSEAERHWVPKSLIEDYDRSGDSITLWVKEWFAEKEELL